jgi:hypothetical protein
MNSFEKNAGEDQCYNLEGKGRRELTIFTSKQKQHSRLNKRII